MKDPSAISHGGSPSFRPGHRAEGDNGRRPAFSPVPVTPWGEGAIHPAIATALFLDVVDSRGHSREGKRKSRLGNLRDSIWGEGQDRVR
jgi:hypothetical protein